MRTPVVACRLDAVEAGEGRAAGGGRAGDRQRAGRPDASRLAQGDDVDHRRERVRDVDGVLGDDEVVEEGRAGVGDPDVGHLRAGSGVVDEHAAGDASGDPEPVGPVVPVLDLHSHRLPARGVDDDGALTRAQVAAVDVAVPQGPDEEAAPVPDGNPLRCEVVRQRDGSGARCRSGDAEQGGGEQGDQTMPGHGGPPGGGWLVPLRSTPRRRALPPPPGLVPQATSPAPRS